MFDISIGEFVLLSMASYVFLGRKDVMTGTKMIGKFIGRSVTRVEHHRKMLVNMLESNDMKTMNPELKEGFKIFQEMQSEVRSATMNPIHTVQNTVMRRNEDDVSSNNNYSNTVQQQPVMKQAPERPSFMANNNAHLQQVSIPVPAERPQADRFAITTERLEGGADILLLGVKQQRIFRQMEKIQVTNTSSMFGSSPPTASMTTRQAPKPRHSPQEDTSASVPSSSSSRRRTRGGGASSPSSSSEGKKF